jgi:hypothetical protein
MSVSGATTAQLAQLSQFVVQLRSTCFALQQLSTQINSLTAIWNANILGIIGTPQGTPIVDATNLAGATQLTDTQVTQLFGILTTLASDTFTAGNNTALVLATGPTALL